MPLGLLRLLPIASAVAAAVVVTACTDSADTVATADPPTAADGTAEASGEPGAQVYASSCASCHGAQLEGTDKGPSQLSIVYEPNHHPDAAYQSAIANGAMQHHWSFGDMPAVEGLSDEEVTAVIAFIRSEQQRLGFQG